MRTRALILAALVVLMAESALALPRHPLRGPPKIARGVVERFLILRKQLLLHGHTYVLAGVAALQGGVLVPVSEDAGGIYYQNLNGVWVYDSHYQPSIQQTHPGIWYRGGLYFSKTKPEDVYAYIGDARKQDSYLEMSHSAVGANALAQLMIGSVAKGEKKSGR